MDACLDERSSRRYRRLVAALILLNLLGACYFLAPQTAGDQIRRHLRKQLQAHYPHLQVQIARGQVAGDGVLVLEGIQFHARSASLLGRGRPILKIDRLSVLSDFQLEKVFDATLPIRPRRVIAEGVVADLWQDDQGRWSPQQLWPPLTMNGRCPQLEIRDGRIRLHRAGATSERPLEVDDIRVALELRQDDRDSSASGPVSPAPGNPMPAAHGNPVPAAPAAELPAGLDLLSGRFAITASGPFVDSIRISGEIKNGEFSLRGEAEGLRVDSPLVRQLPMVTPEQQQHLRDLYLLSDVRWTLQGDPLALLPQADSAAAAEPARSLSYGVQWAVRDGRFDHARLPQPLEKLTGLVRWHPGGAELSSVQGQFGDAQLKLSATLQGWGADAALRSRLSATGLLVNERLARQLPAAAGEAWDRIRPSGPIDLDLQLARIGGVWVPQGTAELRGVDVQLSKFPYPVAQLVGRLQFNDTTMWSEGLSGRIGGQRLSIAFSENLDGHDESTWLQLAADGPVPIDSPLLASLTPLGEPTSPLEQFLRSLSPSGGVHLVAARFDHSPQGQPRKSLDLRVSGGSLRYQGFPYPLYDVRGQITVHDDWVRLVGFQASNSDNARIKCEGRFYRLPEDAPHPSDGQWQLALRFDGRDLPLDETLRAALSETSKRVWDGLSPTGVLDQVEVTIHHAERWEQPQLMIATHQFPRPVIDNRTVSVRAVDIPYRLDIVEGAFRFDGTEVSIDSLDARHDATRIAADGRCRRTDNGQWRLELNVHSGSRLHPDSELIGSLPAEVRGALQRLQLRGPLSARGTVGVMLPDETHLEPTIDWDMILQLEGNRIGDVALVHDLRGEITMQGKRDSTSVIADGTVQIDSLHVASRQITAIQGPFGIRDDRLLLGEALVMAQHWRGAGASGAGASGAVNSPLQPRPIQGELFGGKLSLSGEVWLLDGEFDVVLAIQEADVATMLVELGQADSSVTGKAQGQVRLEGVVGAAHLLKGVGNAKLSQANLYQLPLLISVFNMLRVKPSEAVAFTDGETRFSIYGDQVTFSELRVWGDLIALYGSGTMNRSHEVDLSFNTQVSPQNIWSRVVRPLGETPYTLWTLNVHGPLSGPQVERRAMESVGGTLERLLPGLVDPVPTRPGQLSKLRERLFR